MCNLILCFISGCRLESSLAHTEATARNHAPWLTGLLLQIQSCSTTSRGSEHIVKLGMNESTNLSHCTMCEHIHISLGSWTALSSVILFETPDRIFRPFRAYKSVNFLRSSGTSMDGFWGSKIANGWVGHWVYIRYNYAYKLISIFICILPIPGLYKRKQKPCSSVHESRWNGAIKFTRVLFVRGIHPSSKDWVK